MILLDQLLKVAKEEHVLAIRYAKGLKKEGSTKKRSTFFFDKTKIKTKPKG